MGNASYTQTSFLGGEISRFAQGQFDKPFYKKSLNKVFNFWPTDEGALARRPGFRCLGSTHKGEEGRLVTFNFSEATPYNLEFTDNLIRMWSNKNLADTNDSQLVAGITSASPAVFSLNQPVTWQTGDGAYFTFDSAQGAFAGAELLNKQFILTMLSTTTFTVADALTGVVVSTVNFPNTGGVRPIVNHALHLQTTYSISSNDWHSVRAVQGYNLTVLLHTSVAPRALEVAAPPTATDFATFAYGVAPFKDGPYLDPIVGTVAYTSSTTSLVQVTIGYPQWIATNTVYGLGALVTYNNNDYISLINNNSNQQPDTSTLAWQVLSAGSALNSGRGFLSTDLGRMIRIYYNPRIWSPTVTYAAGANVTYNGAFFTALTGSNLNNEPDISLSAWALNTSIAYWTWGKVITVVSSNSVIIQLQGSVLLDTTPVLTWRLGAWSDTTGWPTCGCYQEGRLWYSGAIPNRTDSSKPNEPFNMAPTGQDGTVADNNAITYTFNADENNPVFWGIPDHDGILWGTQEGEFLMTSGTPGAPMSPTNIKARRETKYGSSNILPVRTGLTICFVKRYARRLMEYLADAISSRFFGNDLTQNARHLGARGFEELAYQEELIPTVWGRCKDGSLIGSTYRRNSTYSTQEPEFNAWHQHLLGSERVIDSIAVGSSVNGTLDALSLVSNDQASDVHFVEQMTTLLDEEAPVTQSWFLDTAVTPGAAAADIHALFSTSTTGSASLDAGMRLPNATAFLQSAVKPIIAAGSISDPSAFWIGGYINPGASCALQVENIAVNNVNNNAAISATYTSSTFSHTPTDMSWGASPNGRYIAMYLGDSTTHIAIAIFDTQTLTFGTPLLVTLGANLLYVRQIAWVDNTHLVLTNYSSTTAGVEVFSVSGTTVTALGFTAVWGSGSTLTRSTLGFRQFIPNPNGNGLIHFMTNISGSSFSEIYGVSLSWTSGALVVGSTYTIVSGLSPGSTPPTGYWDIVQTNPTIGEWTFSYFTTTFYCFLSFIPSTNSATVTRDFQKFLTVFSDMSFTTTNYLSGTNTLIVAQQSNFENSLRVSNIFLDERSFILLNQEAVVSNVVNTGGTCYGVPIGSDRFIVLGSSGGNFNIGNIVIAKDTTGQPSQVTFYGLDNYEGKKVSVFAAAIDCGDYIVKDGEITIDLEIVDPVTGWAFNEQSFKLLQPNADEFSELSVTVLWRGITYKIPCVIGFNYVSRGQLCRPEMPVDTGAKNGPGFGKKRKTARYAMQVVNAISVRLGTLFSKTKPAPLTKIDAGGKRLNYLETFSGIVRETLDDDFSYDSMLAFEVTRPYPCTITILGGFIETTDV